MPFFVLSKSALQSVSGQRIAMEHAKGLNCFCCSHIDMIICPSGYLDLARNAQILDSYSRHEREGKVLFI